MTGWLVDHGVWGVLAIVLTAQHFAMKAYAKRKKRCQQMADKEKDEAYQRQLDRFEDAMEPLSSHNWEPPPFKRR